MAAIAGVLRLGGRTDALPALRHVIDGLAHRAPHGVGVGDDGCFALAHGALHTTAESALERQPIRLGARWLVAVDGRVDDRDGLGRALGLDPAQLASTGDAQLFALAWQRWGSEFWRHIVGDFAFAAWDREERRLHLLRDRVGVRPLFFARSNQQLAFASEPEALLGLEGISRVCETDALAYLLADGFEFEDQEKTFYRDVRRLRAGWMGQASSDGTWKAMPYWQLPAPQSAPLTDPKEAIDGFIDVFDAATRSRLRGLSRATLLLSGGIDSGSVLASVRRLHPQPGSSPLRLHSLVEAVDPISSETRNILKLHAGSDGMQVPIENLTSQPVFSELLTQVWNAAHPIDNSLLYARLGCLLAHDQDSRVFMDGADGDVVMSSRASLAGAMLAAGRPLRALREARLASSVNTYLQGLSSWRILMHGVAAEWQPESLARWRYQKRYRLASERDTGEWLDPSFSKRLQLGERRLDAALATRKRRADLSRREQIAWDWANPGFQRAMEGTDRTFGHFGIEAWHPWCDQRVVDFFLDLPEEFLARDGWTKWVARAACAPQLGANVAWYSGKSHLGAALGPMLLKAAPEGVSKLLASARERLQGVVDADAVGRLRRDWNANPDAAIAQAGDTLFDLATLAGWMERYQLQID
ncbi:MAG: asparagine synthetase B [Thermomonas sp.]|uniref:asparagine synthase-related protein n=1 Tax=Thermomonas sp. TaxID=1971895 RepID=UPI002627A8F3|nr:asparagine synthase-related protein [Thermomonas sp.]MCC7097654.1 asparagine synthetase B [Thermomonas sp.]